MTARANYAWSSLAAAFLGLAMAVMLTGCASAQRGLPTAHKYVDGTARVFYAAIQTQCLMEIDKCRADGVKVVADCPKYMKCDGLMHTIETGVQLVEAGMLRVDDALALAKAQGWLK